MNARRFVTLVVAAVLPLAACGLPEDARPRLVEAADAPLDLVPTTAAPIADAGEETVDVFFIDASDPAAPRLRRVRRPVDAVTVAAAIDALLTGLAEEEQAELINTIPQGVVRLGSVVDAGILTLDLGPAGNIQAVFPQGPAQLQAFAQLVFTATSVPDVTGVRFLVGGQPIDGLTDAGAVSEAVGRDDYASLSPANG